LQLEKEGKATIEHITEQWVSEKLQEYNGEIIEDASVTGKKIKMKKQEVTKMFLINLNFEITELTGISLISKISLGMEEEKEITLELLEELSDEIIWQTEDTEGKVIQITGTGKTITVLGVGAGTTKITAKCGKYEASCEVTVVKEYTEAELKGGFAKYDVSYTDVLETSFTYNAYNGWRILNVTPWESDSSKYDISLISTGLPAGINFKRDTFVSNVPESDKAYDENGNLLSGGSIGKWAANNAQYNLYSQTFTVYPNSFGHVSAKMAIGLYYNFEDVIFSGINYGSAVNNRGYFINIAGKAPGDEVTGSVFRSEDELASKITSVRPVTMTDVAERYRDVFYVTCPSIPAGGENNQSLWNFQKLNSDEQSVGRNFPSYSISGSWGYYFASPSYQAHIGDFLMCFTGVGTFSYSQGLANPKWKPLVRPVVSLSGVSITYDSENGVYELH